MTAAPRNPVPDSELMRIKACGRREIYGGEKLPQRPASLAITRKGNFMFLFDLLFGKKTSASPAPAQPAQGDPHTHTAPGTRIQYHADLIDKLTRDHHHLLTLFGKTQAAARSGDVIAAAAWLESFRISLQDHLLTENVRLYVYLEHLLADDPRSHALIQDFRHEMDGVGKTLVAFLGRYQDLATRPDLAKAFAEELTAIGGVLVQRIEREESTLYPLYTAA